MTINGIEALVYGVDDVARSVRFFEDFGLPLVNSDAAHASFRLEEGSRVEIRNLNDPLLPPSASLIGQGVREVIWGVDTAESLNALVAGLEPDHKLRVDSDGTVHFVPSFGIPMGFRVFEKKAVVYAPDPVNAPGHVTRLNRHRKWRMRARPKVIQHVVFQLPEYDKAQLFMRERLGFYLTDIQDTFAYYLRANGTNNHHNILMLNANGSFPGNDGTTRFHHANFGVEDIDEMMVGVNHLVRQGWAPSELGLGRHRIDSALFYYVPCPAGGEAEYGADSDYVDDSWVPRRWLDPLFAFSYFNHNLPPFLKNPPAWEIEYLESPPPAKG